MTKPFSWSFSRLKNFETCPYRFEQVQLRKVVQDEKGEAAIWGDNVHKACQRRIQNKQPLPTGMTKFEKYMKAFDDFPGKIIVERQMALTREFTPTGWFAQDTWVRVKNDATAISPSGKSALIIDWKTGKVDEDVTQLDLQVFAAFQYYPKLEKATAFYAWVSDGSSGSIEKYTRGNVGFLWGELMPRVNKMEKAHVEGNFPKRQSGLCRRHCPVTGCEYNGRRG